MNNKALEYFQQEQDLDKISIPSIDINYLLLNRCIKYILNFLLIYLFVTLIMYNYPSTSVHLFIIIICAISSVVFYILDLNFPSCYI